MIDSVRIRLADAEITTSAGRSLATSLYRFPLEIALFGELGAGKTTFTQGLLSGLSVSEAVTSPTFALEQRYEAKGKEILHMDLYRLSKEQAQTFMHDARHSGDIRIIEWANRMETETNDHEAYIDVRLKDDGTEGRELSLDYCDIPLPSRKQIEEWRRMVHLPAHIIAHCDAVAAFTQTLAEDLLQRGILLRPLAVKRAAELHDLFRFVDFKEGVSHFGHAPTKEQEDVWDSYKRTYSDLRHEPLCATFLTEQGFPDLATIVRTHGLRLPSSTDNRTTIEQKVLYYADKRLKVDELVTLEERFADFAVRYTGGKEVEESKIWFAEAKALEEELEITR